MSKSLEGFYEKEKRVKAMKKFFTGLLTLSLMLVAVGCGAKDEPVETVENTIADNKVAQEETAHKIVQDKAVSTYVKSEPGMTLEYTIYLDQEKTVAKLAKHVVIQYADAKQTKDEVKAQFLKEYEPYKGIGGIEVSTKYGEEEASASLVIDYDKVHVPEFNAKLNGNEELQSLMLFGYADLDFMEGFFTQNKFTFKE